MIVRGDKLLSDLSRGTLHREFLLGTKDLVKVRVTVEDICPPEEPSAVVWLNGPGSKLPTKDL